MFFLQHEVSLKHVG